MMKTEKKKDIKSLKPMAERSVQFAYPESILQKIIYSQTNAKRIDAISKIIKVMGD